MTSPYNQQAEHEVKVARVEGSLRELLTEVLLNASDDPDLDNNSVPRLRTGAEVENWLEQEGWDMWVITEDTVPVGYVGFHEPQLFEETTEYEGSLEIDYYVLPEFRGKRIISHAWRELKKCFPSGTQFVAEVWEDNKSSITFCVREGWQYVGRFYWADKENPDNGGYCQRYTYTLS